VFLVECHAHDGAGGAVRLLAVRLNGLLVIELLEIDLRRRLSRRRSA
jgi:hypothetical protein